MASYRELELHRNSFLLIAPGEPTLGPPSWEMTFVCSLARVVSAYAVAILKDLKGQAPLTDLLYRSCVAQAPYYIWVAGEHCVNLCDLQGNVTQSGVQRLGPAL